MSRAMWFVFSSIMLQSYLTVELVVGEILSHIDQRGNNNYTG